MIVARTGRKNLFHFAENGLSLRSGCAVVIVVVMGLFAIRMYKRLICLEIILDCFDVVVVVQLQDRENGVCPQGGGQCGGGGCTLGHFLATVNTKIRACFGF